jgi:hypothetical protein
MEGSHLVVGIVERKVLIRLRYTENQMIVSIDSCVTYIKFYNSFSDPLYDGFKVFFEVYCFF